MPETAVSAAEGIGAKHIIAEIAQLVEHNLARNGGSVVSERHFQPRQGIGAKHIIAEIAQLVEHNLAKVGVASSSLVFRSVDAGTFQVPASFCFRKTEASASDSRAVGAR